MAHQMVNKDFVTDNSCQIYDNDDLKDDCLFCKHVTGRVTVAELVV